MKKADGSSAVCAIIIGDDEVRAGVVTLKPLRGGEQVKVAPGDLAGNQPVPLLVQSIMQI